MTPKLYGFDASPPTRAVLLTVKALGISIDYHKIDYMGNEHKSPEFIKMNPQHTLPTLTDDGSVIWDSHAIMVYLVEKYGKDDALYPKDHVQKAVINQRLHFDSGCVFATIRRAMMDMRKSKTVHPDTIELADVQYQFLDAFLDGIEWAAGNALTIADLSLISSITTLIKIVPHNPSYKNLSSWIERCEKLPFMDINRTGLHDVDAILTKICT